MGADPLPAALRAKARGGKPSAYDKSAYLQLFVGHYTRTYRLVSPHARMRAGGCPRTSHQYTTIPTRPLGGCRSVYRCNSVEALGNHGVELRRDKLKGCDDQRSHQVRFEPQTGFGDFSFRDGS